MKEFIFLEDQPNISRNIFINKNLETEEEVLEQFSKHLEFPDYFGMNWDALKDCLFDLSWIEQKSINIFHMDVPLKNNFNDRRIYLEILVDVLEFYEENELISFKIYFPVHECNMINEILKDYKK